MITSLTLSFLHSLLFISLDIMLCTQSKQNATTLRHAAWALQSKWNVRPAQCLSPCRIRSDRQTTSLTLTTGVWETGTKMRGASNMNIHYDVTGLLTAAWRSHSGQIVWAA